MNVFTKTLRAYAADARNAFRDAPVEVLLGLLVTVSLWVQVRIPREFPDEDWGRLLAGAALAFPLVLAATVLHARGTVRAPARWLLTAAALAAAGAYAALVFHPDRESEALRLLALGAAAVLALLLVPAAPPDAGERRERVWRFGFGVVLRAIAVLAYAAVLYVVLAGAIGAVVELFELREPRHLYGDVAAAVFFAFAPWIFVGGVRRLLEPPPPGTPRVPAPVSAFGRFLYVPVAAIYLLILYAYVVRVGVTGEVPKNLVSPLVLAAGLAGLLGALLLEPVHGDDEHRGLSLFVRWIPVALLPLLPFAAWAVLQRQEQYGWTTFRYLRLALVLLLCVLAVLGTLRLVRRRAPLLTTVLAVLAAGLFLSAAGPWGAPAVSRRDQQHRLEAALRDAGLRDARAWATLPTRKDSVPVTPEQYERITSTTTYLIVNHGPAAVRRFFAVPDTAEAWVFARTGLALRQECVFNGITRVEMPVASGPLRVSAGWMLPFSVDSARARRTQRVQAPGVPAATLSLEGERLVLRGAGWEAAADLRPLREAAAGRGERGGGCHGHQRSHRSWLEPQEASLTLADAAGRPRAQVLLQQVGATLREGHVPPAFAGVPEGVFSASGTLILIP